MITISPSLLPVKPELITNYANKSIKLGVSRLHLDIIDGKFVNKFGLDSAIVQEILKKYHLDVAIDIHLMVIDPLDYIELPHYSYASKIYIHYQKDKESLTDLKNLIEKKGCEAGLVINPDDHLDPETINLFSSILVMGVVPGMSGQKMLPNTYERINLIKSLSNDQKKHITLDGGVTKAHLCTLENKVDCCVMGAAIYSQVNWEKELENILISVK